MCESFKYKNVPLTTVISTRRQHTLSMPTVHMKRIDKLKHS